jgi:CO/xanthine dehydrogenase Mo-binding subunit
MTTTRAGFLTGATALIVVAGAAPRGFAVAADAPAPAQTSLGAWLRMRPDGDVEMYTDKVEVGMGVPTGFAQFVADELDIPIDRVRPMLGDTSDTVAAGGVGGSFSTYLGSPAIRNAAAEMRRILLAAASKRLGVPVEGLYVRDGVVHASPAENVAYVDLLAAFTPDPAFPLVGDGFTSAPKVPAQPKPWSEYRIVGTSVPRFDARAKAFGRYPYVVNVRVPGMLHGRYVTPPSIGATVVAVDDAKLHGIGDARVVRIRDFVAVVATREWDAIRGAQALAVTWSAPSTTLPKQADLAAYMWAQPVIKTDVVKTGDVASALGTAPLAAEYRWPFQSHANMGPGCSVVDVRADGVTVWSGTQKTHALRLGMARLLNVPVKTVRVQWVSDAGSYGRGGLEESTAAAALLSRAVGKPVRVQSMRADNTRWGNKGPAIVARMRGTVKDGKIVAFDATLRQFNGNEVVSHPDVAGSFLAAQLAGIANPADTFEFGQYGKNSAAYTIPNMHASAELIAPFAPNRSPLRTAHMRDPEGPGTTWIIESFVDELAAAAGADAVEFRKAHLKDPRHIDVVARAAAAADWATRPSATHRTTDAHGNLVGRGIAFATREATIVATVAEVAVNPQTGKVRVTKITCAHDCGFVVNPQSLQGTIEANLIQSISRSIYEQVTWDDHTVTSHDWLTYPIAHTPDVPDVVNVVMIHRPDIAPAGAGEPSSRTTAAAIGNAVFDATGVRVRTAPLTPANVLAAMKATPVT